jgi:hypothetical protein
MYKLIMITLFLMCGCQAKQKAESHPEMNACFTITAVDPEK